MTGPADIDDGAAGFNLVEQVSGIFSATGLLSGASNFEYRPQQQDMAVAVARALETKDHLITEAGTGVAERVEAPAQSQA